MAALAHLVLGVHSPLVPARTVNTPALFLVRHHTKGRVLRMVALAHLVLGVHGPLVPARIVSTPALLLVRQHVKGRALLKLFLIFTKYLR